MYECGVQIASRCTAAVFHVIVVADTGCGEGSVCRRLRCPRQVLIHDCAPVVLQCLEGNKRALC